MWKHLIRLKVLRFHPSILIKKLSENKNVIYIYSLEFFFVPEKKMNKTSYSNQISSFFIGSYAKYQYVSKLRMQVYIIYLIAIVKICCISC